VEYCTALHEELLVASEMLEEGICFSPYSQKLTTLFRWYLNLAMVLARKGVEVHPHAAPTKTEHLWLGLWANCHLEKNAFC